MRKFFLTILLFCFTLNVSMGDELRLERDTKYQKKVMEIGYRILNANQIEKRMTFHYENEKTVNAFARSSSKNITVFKGLLPYFDDDNELAAVIAHEIAHGLDFHAGFWRIQAMRLNSIKYETKADKVGIDLMVNAGYNPVAMILVHNKISAEQNWYEASATHPTGSDRLSDIYEYIYAKYPAYLADNEYKTNIYYQNFLLTSKKSRELIRQKYAPKEVVPVTNKTKK